MKKLFYPLLALSVSGLTGCAPSTFPDMPDDKTCYRRVQEITTQLKESDSLDPETYATLNPDPYLSVLCARGKLRKVCISVERKEQMRGLFKVVKETPEIIYWQGSGRAFGVQNYEHPTHDLVTLYFWSKDTPQVLAMLRRLYGK